MRLSDENLHGRAVIGADGQALGTVAALFLDADQWKIESVQVELARAVADQIGASRGVFRAGVVEVPVRLIQSAGDTLVLSVSADSLREVLPQSEQAAPH